MRKSNDYLLPIILVTSLFFLWGMAYGLLDVLNKHFQDILGVTKSRSMFLQAAYFGAYFVTAIPAGLFMQRWGYKKGIIAGLLLYATGALLFFPSAETLSFPFFLVSTFIIASGLTFLETAANPYITVLGKPETSEFRLNLSQSFNGVGSFLGPMIAAELFFSKPSVSGSELNAVKYVYIVIAAIVLVVAFLFVRTKMPQIREEELVTDKQAHSGKSLFSHSHFVWAVVAQFFYVAAQVGIAALFINYCTERGLNISSEKASKLLGVAMLLFTAGRFTGTALMRWIAPHRLLALYSLINIALCGVVVWVDGKLSIWALMAILFFESIMFPTIFALGVKNLGRHTKRGSSFIIMSIVGGAIIPYVMGRIAEKYSNQTAYLVPMICFVFVFIFAVYGYRVKSKA